MLQNWIENKQISLLKLQEIIQKRRRTQKKIGKDCSQTEFLVGYDDIKKEKQARGLLSIKLQ